VTETRASSQPTIDSTATLQPPTKTPTFIPVTEKLLAGLIISSPILGTPIEVPGVQPPEMITPNGLGIINSEGRLIKFSGAGLFESFSPSGTQIVYQHGFEDEYYDHIDNLFVYNSMTGDTVEIIDDLENEGGKTIISWAQDEQEFIYYNDFLTVLFEAYGYFEPKQLLRADIQTGKTKLLLSDGYQFDVNPDQTQIAYTTGEILVSKTDSENENSSRKFGCFQPRIYNIASSVSLPFGVDQLSEKPVCLGYPKWSPDGQKIAWMGYFQDDTFRSVVFDLDDKTGRVYDALDKKPVSTNFPTSWFFGEPYFGGYFEPNWIDNSIFWTPSYEVNVETGEISAPREINPPYSPRRDKYIKSLDGLFNVSLNEERDIIKLNDTNGNVRSSFLLDELYDGERYEILTSGFFLQGWTEIVGWSPFVPPPNIENNK
jgi:hypothetical protein